MSRTAQRRTARLHLGLTGWALILFALYHADRTWPIQTRVLATVLALAAVTAVVLLRRLTPHARRQLLVTLPRPRRAAGRSLAAYQAMDGTQFEHAIARLARRDRNVRSAIAQGGANDRGLDVLVHLRDGRSILIQCKRYTPPKNVTSEDVQKTNGTYRDIHHCVLAVIVTTSRFTGSALETNKLLARPLVLVDGPALADWAAGGAPPWQTVPASR